MKITIGHAEKHPVAFDLDVLLGTRLLIQANSGAGKSFLLRRLMEQLFPHVQVIAIDPEGEFATLREKYGYVLVGKGGETPADARIAGDVAEKLLEIRASAVCDLYELKPSERHRWVQVFLEALINAPKKLWHPVVIIVDEAHVFCPERSAGESVASEAMMDLSTRGRKRGFCAVWATQRLAKVRKDATAELLNRLVGGTFEDVDIKRALDLLSVAPEDKHEFSESLKTIDPGWFYAFGRAVSKQRVLFKVDAVETSHPKPGSTKHAAAPPPTPDKVRELLPSLADLPQVAEKKAQNIQALQAEIRSLRGQLAARPKEPPAPKPIVDSLLLKRSLKQRDEAWSRVVREFKAELQRRVRQGLNQVSEFLLDIPMATPEAAVESSPIPAGTLRKETPETLRSARGVEVEALASRSESNGAVTPAQMKILGALAQFEAIGRTQVSKKWIAALAGASHSSSSYSNNLGALRTAGLIDYPAPGLATLTREGRSTAPHVDPPTSAKEMLDYCLSIVTPAQGRILKALHEAYPRELQKAELAELAGASANSSSFSNNLGGLRSAGMIDYPSPGTAKCADWLLMEETGVAA